ncbi:hypothetical protein A2704_06475 [Candidatus Kaiserbacteria bacterium RIFCSPHIGHO2_01_FULL_54_36b]|uniref:Uncharacterized protein n=1 Tax=Candidatus Kaiserbacteria bacterium RIFCSPHIGHO2_01_FULL_54_36b TaxID=1798483 RepID=A0A1F6CNV1_9BACT|nr:MAG: hypothetical protein A2704_06475 [Candidatus Kaiserbacteria bacterium RIFCSPHIGHO2_01_FULL_54_36b]
MNSSVVLFFVTNVIATALLGGKFISRNDSLFKYFGIGLLLDAVAFAMWTIGYVNPEQLLTFVTFGAVALLVSLVVFLYASLEQAPASTRLLVTILGGVAVAGIFYVGRYVDPANAFISPEGFLFFNLTPFVQMLYTFALALVTLPVIDLVARKFSAPYSALVRYGLIAEVVGGIMLITNKDVQTLYITGWIIGIVYLALWVTLLFNRKAWSSTN